MPKRSVVYNLSCNILIDLHKRNQNSGINFLNFPTHQSSNQLQIYAKNTTVKKYKNKKKSSSKENIKPIKQLDIRDAPNAYMKIKYTIIVTKNPEQS